MYIDQLIEIAIKEDIGDGDHTSLACIPNTAKGKAHLLVKENGIIAGVELAEKILINSGIITVGTPHAKPIKINK